MENPSLALRSAVLMGVPMAFFGGMGVMQMIQKPPAAQASLDEAVEKASKAAAEAAAREAVKRVDDSMAEKLDAMRSEVEAKVEDTNLDISWMFLHLDAAATKAREEGFARLEKAMDAISKAVDSIKTAARQAPAQAVVSNPELQSATAAPGAMEMRREPEDPKTRNRLAWDPRNGLPLAAFDDLPTVIRLVGRNTLGPEATTEVDRSSYPRLEEENGDARVFDFAAPARFTIPRFGEQGEEFEDEGALIYEGMRFVWAPNGLYEVRFVVSTPAMPVTLRLQFHVPCAIEGGHSITLPPIELPPYVNPRGRFESASWQVRHLGYSNSLLRREDTPVVNHPLDRILEAQRTAANSHLPHLNDGLPGAVRRTGTARFGSKPLSQY